MSLATRWQVPIGSRGTKRVSSRAGGWEGRRWGAGRGVGVEGEVVVVESGRIWEVHD